MINLNGANILVESLKSQDVRYIFGIPGNHVLGLYDALDKGGITHILATHEPSVGFMADTYGRITREPGVAIVTAGPGALNLVNPTAQAYVESSPMVIIAAQCDMRNWGKGCYHELEHPEVQYNIFKEITKWQTRITHADEICDKISDAFYQAKSGRSRPVYVEIPENIFSECATFTTCRKKSVLNRGVTDSIIKEIADTLLTADLPVIYAGGGVIISDASKELIELSESLDIPVATTIMGKGSIPEDHPLSLGYSTGKLGTPLACEIINKADVMLAVGSRFDEVATGFFTLKPPEILIHIDIDKDEINKNYDVTLGAVGDAKTILRQIISEISQRDVKKKGDVREKIMKLRKQKQENSKEDISKLSRGIHPLRLIQEIDNLVNDTIIIADAGNSSLWMWEYPISSQILITPAGYNSMGFAIPSVISAKLAEPSKTVIGICGDGSFLMTGMEFNTAVSYNLDINIIVLHDKCYNILNFFQNLNYEGRHVDTILHTFDFAKFANNVGGLGIKISDIADIRDSLTKGLNYKGPTLFDVYIDVNYKPSFLGHLKSLHEVQCKKKS